MSECSEICAPHLHLHCGECENDCKACQSAEKAPLSAEQHQGASEDHSGDYVALVARIEREAAVLSLDGDDGGGEAVGEGVAPSGARHRGRTYDAGP